MGFYRAGSKIALTERQEDKIDEQCDKAGLACKIEQCWTGSVYIIIGNKFAPTAKIRLSNHDDGVRGDETTHNAVGTKSEVMKALSEWLPEIFEWHLLPEEEKKEHLRKEKEKIEADKTKEKQREAARDEKWEKEAEEYRKNLTDEDKEKIRIRKQEVQESIHKYNEQIQKEEEWKARGVRRLKVAICLCILKTGGEKK